MTTIVWLLIGGIVVIGGILIAIMLIRFGLGAVGDAGDLQSRLEEYGSRSGAVPTLEEIELAQPFSERVMRPMLVSLSKGFSRLSPEKSRQATELQLQLAGKPYGWGFTEFFGLRVLTAVLLGALLFLVGSVSRGLAVGTVGVGLVGALVGFVAPIIWLRSRIRTRQQDIIKSLPDALDLLTIIVEAGMGFDAGMAKIADKWDNEISNGFAKVVQEMRLGISRRDALRNMDETMGVDDVKTFVAAVIQAETLGVSMAKILRVQSTQMRIKRRQRAEAMANKAPIKMLFPMVFLIFPALFIILLGPALLVIRETPGGFFGQ